MLKSAEAPLVDPGPLDPDAAGPSRGEWLLDLLLDPLDPIMDRSYSSGVGKPVDAKLPRRSGSASVP